MKRVFGFILMLIILVPFTAHAETLQDMDNKLAKLQAEYDQNKNNKNLTKAEIDKANTEIADINVSIEKTREEIKQAEKDIEESKDKIEKKKEETDGMLQFLQVSNGGNIYLEYIFEAESYTDFIYRYEVVKQLTNYNSELIDELEALILELQRKEKELAAKNVKLENDRKALSAKVKTLQYNLASFESEGVDIKKDIEDLKKQIKIYESLGCARNKDVNVCRQEILARQQAQGLASALNASGWRYPLAKGCVTSEYTGFGLRSDWSGGGGHHAIDLDCVSEGTPIYAAASGIVERVTNFATCGGNTVYIYHTINGKKYTTLYMHLLRFASGLKANQIVTENTIIGYVGGYSTASGHGGTDRCTTGTHLHFGIAEGWHAYDFNYYSINPREKYAFPKLVYNGGGYFYR